MPQLQNLIKDDATRLEMVRRGKPRAIQVLKALGVDRVYIQRNGKTVCQGFARAHWPKEDKALIIDRFNSDNYEVRGRVLYISR